ncbi:MAG TPA: RagB/SusD family nutrient uptake outer membrane protein [Paludibacter sp.]|nr:RagB/SusD family nutrient uptake outer membrane protein [Paludibacter sp.]
MKKKILNIAITFALLTGVTSCTDWLDLRPESEIILDEYWMSEADVEGVLSACYRGLTEDAVIYRMMIWGELRSDNIVAGSGFPNERFDIQRILDGDLVSTNSYNSWGSFYTVINYCNTLLEYAPLVLDRDNNFTQDDLNRVEAEALTLRSLAYFYLLRAFKEVPWIEEPSIDDAQVYVEGAPVYAISKATERTIIDNIIRDLKTAQKNARVEYGNTAYNKGRVTLNAVNALLADVYLWDQQYANCVEACNNVLADPKLKLIEGARMLTQVFYLGNSSESIFELQFSENVQKNNPVIELYGSPTLINGELGFPVTLAYNSVSGAVGAYSPFAYKISTNFTESLEDIRSDDSYWEAGGKYYIFKYAGVQRLKSTSGTNMYYFRSNTSNWILYRLSDVMLMKAEAQVQLDGSENLNAALEMVNKTYLRSNEEQDSLRITNYPSKIEMEKLVLRERQRELLFEGKRWFDLVRMARREGSTSTLNDFVDHKSSGNTVSLGAPVPDAMYMPISKSELSANPLLKQNSYYEEAGGSTSR